MFYIRFKLDGDMLHARILTENVADYINVIKACDDVWIKNVPYRIVGISLEPATVAEIVDCVDITLNR